MHGSPKWSPSLRPPHQILFYPIRATCPAYLILLDLITRIIFGNECRSLSFSLCSLLHSPVASSLLGSYINICYNRIFPNPTKCSIHNFFRSLSVLYIACKSSPITGLDRPTGFQGVEAPRFQDNRHMKVVRLSALHTGRLYPPGNIPVTHIC
jgi:hypothetical protein